MDYYKEYRKSCNNSELGLESTILTYKVTRVRYHPSFEASLQLDGKIDMLIIDKVESLNRALFGDKVLFDIKKGEVVEIIEEYNPEIVGILNVNSVVTYGQSPKGLPYYLFKPMNTNYPSFVVPYDKKKHSNPQSAKRDLYTIIKRGNWPISRKNPIGQVNEYIGEPGIYENEISAILVRYDLPRKNVSNKVLRDEPLKEIDFGTSKEGFLDLTGRYVFSIDPEGCEDIDDAMHIERIESRNEDKDDDEDEDENENENENELFEVGIHIADPARFLPKDGIHDRIVQERLTSIYTPTHRVDMLHPDLAIKRASLLEGEVRPVNSILFELRVQRENVIIESVKFDSCLVKLSKNLSYDRAQGLYDNMDKNEKGQEESQLLDSLGQFMRISKVLAENFPRVLPNGLGNMHELVEIWMILANLYAGRELVEKYNTLAPIRVFDTQARHGPTINEVPIKSEIDVPEIATSKQMLKFLQIRQSNSARYTLYDSSLNSKNSHDALGISNYTHFTSPIRRYFDIIVHRMLYPLPDSVGSKYTRNELLILLDNINKRNSNVKKAERAFDRIRIVKELREKVVEKDYPTESERMILVDFGRNSLELWSEAWQTIIKYKVIPKLLRNRYLITEDGLLEDCYSNVIHRFAKFDEIRIRSYPSVTGRPMELFHEILSPKINFESGLMNELIIS